MSDERIAIVVLFGLVVCLLAWLIWMLADKERKLHKLRNLQQAAVAAKALAEKRGEIMAESQVEELSADIAGQKLTLKNAPINTIATVATMVLVVLCLYVLWSHQQDARDASAAFVTAIREQTSVQKEQTVVMREANCLQSYQGPGDGKANFCKQIAR